MQDKNFRNSIDKYDQAFQEKARELSLLPEFNSDEAEIVAFSLRSFAERDDGHWESFLPYIVLMTGIFSALVDTGANEAQKGFVLLVKIVIVIAGSGGAFFISSALGNHIRVLNLAGDLLDVAIKYQGKPLGALSSSHKTQKIYRRHILPLRISGMAVMVVLVIIVMLALVQGAAILP